MGGKDGRSGAHGKNRAEFQRFPFHFNPGDIVVLHPDGRCLHALQAPLLLTAQLVRLT
jgi:hypothetical protein